MLRVTCPWCGERDETEFRYGGPANVVRPPTTCSEEVWAAYLYVRDNPKGLQAERWCHACGCRQWFVAYRNTLTHEILFVGTLSESLCRPDSRVAS
jgi:heterotetrameric sarcosine oxidase delta subunit